jgi:predicted nuclease of predicted toxin-antitoxin system
MKLLFDSCIAKTVYEEILDAGLDADWTGGWEEDPGDGEILRVAHTEGRILVTLDRDFGDLAIRQGMHHCGIILIRKLRIKDQAKHCIEALEQHESELRLGAVVVIEPGKMRCRPAEIGTD